MKETLEETDDLMQSRADDAGAEGTGRSRRADGRRLDGERLTDVLLRAGERRGGCWQGRLGGRVDDARGGQAVRGLERRTGRHRQWARFPVGGELGDAERG